MTSVNQYQPRPVRVRMYPWTFRVGNELRTQVEELATRRGVNPSRVIRAALAREVAAAQDAGEI